MSTRLWIAVIIYPMVQSVLFGLGIVPVLSIPALAAHLSLLVPDLVIASVVMAAPVSWNIAPRLMLRYWRQRRAAEAMAARRKAFTRRPNS